MHLVPKLLAALAIALAIPSAALAASGCQTPTASEVTLVANNTTTSSTSAVNIAGALVEGVVPAAQSCVYVEYTGQFKAPQGARISLVISGTSPTPSVFPATEDIITAGTGFDTRTLGFQLPKVDPCNCSIQVRIQSPSGQQVIGGRGVLRVFFTAI